MELEERNSAGPVGSPVSLREDTHSHSRLRAKLRDKLERLAQWRIPASSIEFPGDGREFSGGYATVSRALLYRPSDIERQDSQAADGERNSLEEDERKHGEQPPTGQTSERKIVAVKKMKIEKDEDLERVLGLALRESEFLVELSHPNIVKLEGFVEDASKNVIWLVFPWEENGSLRDFLASGESQLEIPERISLIHDVTMGLEYLHNQEPPICHGDLKSLNILVNSDCLAMITDFGSARHLETKGIDEYPKEDENKPQQALGLDPTTDQENIPPQATFCAATNTITLTGNSYTLRWAAPELLKDEPPCLGSDVWALGWIAYEIMTNTIPFHDVKNENTVVNRVVRGDLPSITNDARMSLIQALCWLMAQCWSIDPGKRPTAEECRKSISWMPMIAPEPDRTMDTELSQARKAWVLGQLGEMYMRQGDYQNASECYTKALEIDSTVQGTGHKIDILCWLANLHAERGEFSKATPLCSEALQLSTDTDDQGRRAYALFRLADIHRLQESYTDSIKLYSEVLQIHTDMGDRRGRAHALWGLASSYTEQGEYSKATPLYSDALVIYTDLGDQREKAAVMWGLAEIHRLTSDFAEAFKLYSDALQINTNIGARQEASVTLWCLAEVHKGQGEYSKAIERYSESLRIATEIGDKVGRARTLRSLAKTHRQHDHPDDAISLFMEASKAFEEFGQSDDAAEALKNAEDIRKSVEMGHMMETLKVE